MSLGDEYRKRAAELRALAAAEADPIQKAEYLALFQSYLRLIAQAERNQLLDISYETPPKRNADDHSAD